MTGFHEVVSAKLAASATIELTTDAFSATWSGRPRAAIVFGLRVPSERDLQTARAEAVKIAVNLHADGIGRVEAFNDALMAQLVSYAICDPNDVMAPHPLLEFPQDQVQQYLTSRAIRDVFDAVERLQVATSPLFPEADADDVTALIGLLQTDRLTELRPVAAKRVRRFLRFTLDELRQANE